MINEGMLAMSIPLMFLALAMGAIISIYLPMIAQSARYLGMGPMANVPFFAVALISSVIIALGAGARAAEFAKIGTIPPLLLTAGVMSAAMIIGSTYLVPRLGIGVFFVLMVSGQVIASMVFGHFGLFGVPATDPSVGKFAGAALVVVGVWLVTFK